ncbi:uncharacterized protein CC84DRAFT_269242 [Paraphaeosphaeria sporulosa]|uniref:Uncharacterized protein n=1 Tax=Paraphaeosphaeria sporulosa TaxID=1460663 RepID=A0A177C096_9PLEO|nr:uncharacterized protein CC84DRAFT_269242 [Paraphaeosphaeria sporulosa]OAG00895.1 hypothetical protein CC84DRAFT_269242 [Paraphaeosphaeria sporulosa]
MARFARAEGANNDYNHHCRTCKGAVTTRCFEKYHIYHCEECGTVFQSFSKSGCNYHTYADGYNLKVKKVKSGLPEHHRTPFELQLEATIRAERERRGAEATRTAAAQRDPREEESRKANRGKKSKVVQKAEKRRPYDNQS